jgi:hypothetical protein
MAENYALASAWANWTAPPKAEENKKWRMQRLGDPAAESAGRAL